MRLRVKANGTEESIESIVQASMGVSYERRIPEGTQIKPLRAVYGPSEAFLFLAWKRGGGVEAESDGSKRRDASCDPRQFSIREKRGRFGFPKPRAVYNVLDSSK